MLRLSLFFSFLLCTFFSLSQIVEEKIQLDTATRIIEVIYKTDVQSAYYFKKVAVFANDTSQIAIEKSYNKYGQNGLYKVYYPNGRLKIKTVFANNKINGEWVYYDTNGIIILKGNYDKGVKHGYWAYKSLRIYGRYWKGVKNWKWKRLDENGKKYSSHYKNGILTGGEGYEGDEKIEGVPVRRNIFARIFPKKTKQTESVAEELDTIKGEPIQEYQDAKISKEYQQAISFLTTNALFRRKTKAYFGSSIKKYFKKEKFLFAILPETRNLGIEYFMNESKAGKIDVVKIDSILKEGVNQVSSEPVFQEDVEILLINEYSELADYSTDINSLVKILFSEIMGNFLRLDVLWGKDDKHKEFQILLYFNDDGELKGAEYQKH